MESIRDRLKRMTRDRQGAAGEAKPARPPEPPAFAVELRTTRFPLDSVHGETPLAGLWPPRPNFYRLAGLPAPPPEAPPPALLFLDTETTGLAGGTGTLAFLAGTARLDPSRGELVVEQYFLPDPSAEPVFLAPLAEALGRAGLLACFNGKSYDLPLLNTRFILNGFPPVPADLPVADLLHPARRRWKGDIGACDQRSVERHALGVLRRGDIPGELIPDLYFRYLRDRDRGPLEEVFRHNLLDMLGMAALFARLNTLVPEAEPARDPADWACLLGTLDARNRLDEFEEIFALRADALLEAGRRHLPAGRVLARLLKRVGRREESWRLYLHLGTARPRDIPESFTEVLKYEEHVLRDHALALRHCDEFEEVLLRLPGVTEVVLDLRRRRERLRKKTQTAQKAQTTASEATRRNRRA